MISPAVDPARQNPASNQAGKALRFDLFDLSIEVIFIVCTFAFLNTNYAILLDDRRQVNSAFRSAIARLALHRADVAGVSLKAGQTALVGCQAVYTLPGIKRRTAGQEHMGQGRSSVIGQRAKQGVYIILITALIEPATIVTGEIKSI
jgi:hypothetical protein